jgi:hypothetical protein
MKYLSIETTGLKPGEIIMARIDDLILFHSVEENPAQEWNGLECGIGDTTEVFSKRLQEEINGQEIVLHNSKFTLPFLKKYGCEDFQYLDLMKASKQMGKPMKLNAIDGDKIARLKQLHMELQGCANSK